MQAELHGKIASSGSNLSERLEDQLTGDVFGALRYLPPEIGIMPVLRKASHHFSSEKLPSVCHVEYIFWRRYKGLGETDLVIELYDLSGGIVAVVGIEVKYFSDISPSESETTTFPAEEDEPPRHQLHRYMKLLSMKYPNTEKFLLYLTTKAGDAKNEIKTAEQLDKGKSAVQGLSMSWSMVCSAIAEQEKKKHPFPSCTIIEDVMKLLTRKNLNSFEAIRMETRSFPKYRFASSTSYSLILDTKDKVEYIFTGIGEKYQLEIGGLDTTFMFKCKGE